MKLILGLGNPGKEYSDTRHNMGWMAVDVLAQANDAELREKEKFHARIAEIREGDERIILAQPTTFMNASGDALLAIMQFYKIEAKEVLVVQDEMDLPLGELAFLASGGNAGHNGITSIQEKLGHKNIARLRLGIGRPLSMQAKESFVLEPFSKEDAVIKQEILKEASFAIKDWIALGLTRAMNSWNGFKHGVDKRADSKTVPRAL